LVEVARCSRSGALYLPDRTGNNRLDGFRNILGGSGEVSLIFFIPGVDDTVRIAGRAKLSVTPYLLGQMLEFGRPPLAALVVEPREIFFHCPKALMRSRLSDPSAQISGSMLPSAGEIIRDQTRMGEAWENKDMLEQYAREM
jgi:predicted pyridoxine 5'-phosphate oxidase superfamily flavin-nucleotide-binding protein